jgi:hypothetical protein
MAESPTGHKLLTRCVAVLTSFVENAKRKANAILRMAQRTSTAPPGKVSDELFKRLMRNEISVKQFFQRADRLPDCDLQVLFDLLRHCVDVKHRAGARGDRARETGTSPTHMASALGAESWERTA